MNSELDILMAIKDGMAILQADVAEIKERSLNTQNDTRYLTQQFDDLQTKLAKTSEKAENNGESIKHIKNCFWGVLSAVMIFMFTNYLIRPYMEDDAKYIKPKTIVEELQESEGIE